MDNLKKCFKADEIVLIANFLFLYNLIITKYLKFLNKIERKSFNSVSGVFRKSVLKFLADPSKANFNRAVYGQQNMRSFKTVRELYVSNFLVFLNNDHVD